MTNQTDCPVVLTLLEIVFLGECCYTVTGFNLVGASVYLRSLFSISCVTNQNDCPVALILLEITFLGNCDNE